jgi:hypothetical protein
MHERRKWPPVSLKALECHAPAGQVLVSNPDCDSMPRGRMRLQDLVIRTEDPCAGVPVVDEAAELVPAQLQMVLYELRVIA